MLNFWYIILDEIDIVFVILKYIFYVFGVEVKVGKRFYINDLNNI